MNNNDNTMEQQLQKYAETIKRIHDKLMSMPYSFKENKEQGRRIVAASGRLFEAYALLRGKK